MGKSLLDTGFFGTLTLILVLCKIFGKIDWSWWLVLSPAIFSFSLAIIFLILLMIIAVVTD